MISNMIVGSRSDPIDDKRLYGAALARYIPNMIAASQHRGSGF